MASRSATLYKDSPSVERDGDGKPAVRKGPKEAPKAPDKEEQVADGTEGMPVEARHAHERRMLHHKHMTEHMALHQKHESEHAHEGDKAPMHERHEGERAAMHKEHAKELAAMHDKHEQEMSGEGEAE